MAQSVCFKFKQKGSPQNTTFKLAITHKLSFSKHRSEQRTTTKYKLTAAVKGV